jgi:hypothetical protein
MMNGQEKKEYWLPISLWNFNELFTTESVSPYIFHQLRGFGNPSARQQEPGENEHYLTLYHQAPESGPALKINPRRLNSAYLEHLADYSCYFQTIYVNRGDFICYFENDAQMQMLTMNSRMLLEVKAIEKHRFKGTLSFQPFQLYNPKIFKAEALARVYTPNSNTHLLTGAGFDRARNQIKGLIFGLYRGILSQPGAKAMELENVLRSWRNAIGTARTNIAMTNEYSGDWANEINSLGERVAVLYLKDSSGRRESLDILKLRLAEIDKLYLQKSEELRRENAPAYQHEYQQCINQVEQARAKLWAYEDAAGISEVRRELQEIKDSEKQNGIAKGKSRSYFPKGSPQAQRKAELNESISAFSHDIHYAALSYRLSSLEEALKGFRFGGSQYDSTIDDQFSRISGLVSDILDHTIARAQNQRSTNRFPKLSGLKVNTALLIDFQAKGTFERAIVPKFIEGLPEELQLEPADHKLLLLALNAALATTLINQGNISNAQVLHFTEILGISLSAESNPAYEDTTYILEHLRNYLKYKNGKIDAFEFPRKGIILENIFAFMLRPSSFESIEKLTNEKGIAPGYFATTLWASVKGFADLPKTFTEVI